MGQTFVVITGVGHAATKWAAMVLDRPRQGVRFEHEPLMKVSKPNWPQARRGALTSLDGAFYTPYWPHVKKNLARFITYGDSQSWNPLEMDKLNEKVPIARVIFLVRHGVPQLHSIWQKSLWNRHAVSGYLYGQYLRRYWHLEGQPDPPWHRRNRWRMLCTWWNSNAFMPRIVRKWLPDATVEVHKTEDLTGDVDKLSAFVKSFGLELSDKTLVRLQGQDLNRKVQGVRTATHLWQFWSGKQKSSFKQLCGPGMKKLGYRMP